MSKQDFKPGNTFFQNLGKFVVGGLGWGLGGPLGAVIGVAIGSVIDNMKAATGSNGQTTRGDFNMSLLVLIAAIMKADGTVRKMELDYVKLFLIRNFGREGSMGALRVLKDLLKQDIDIVPVCIQIREHMNNASRLQLLYFLVNIAAIDERIDSKEEWMLHLIAGQIGISEADWESIRSMFNGEQEHSTQNRRPSLSKLDKAYRVLEIDRNADVAAVKKAYRAMAVKHHPDKVAYLGEDVKKAANEKFQRLNEAYEIIKKDKGFI